MVTLETDKVMSVALYNRDLSVAVRQKRFLQIAGLYRCHTVLIVLTKSHTHKIISAQQDTTSFVNLAVVSHRPAVLDPVIVVSLVVPHPPRGQDVV